MIDATEITDVTPITMPSIVNPERTLRALSVSSATRRFSRTSPRVISFAPQRRHRIEPRRFHRRVNSEEDADHRTEKNSEQRHPGLHRRRKRRESPQRDRAGEPNADP